MVMTNQYTEMAYWQFLGFRKTHTHSKDPCEIQGVNKRIPVKAAIEPLYFTINVSKPEVMQEHVCGRGDDVTTWWRLCNNIADILNHI